MKSTIIGVSKEVLDFTKEDLISAETFSGKNAGICYMKDSYFDSSVSDPVKALPRFRQVIGTTHHSISDHIRVEVLFENISKMLAIVLNSLQDYATSEKSGRYTVMKGNSQKEVDLYNGWINIFKDCILEKYPDIDDAVLNKAVDKKFENSGFIVKNGRLVAKEPKSNIEVNEELHSWFYNDAIINTAGLPSVKLAQENARYILSVFTRSTTMGYSTSIRQWNYIYDWCLKYMDNYYFDDNVLISKRYDFEASYFEKELYNDFKELSEFIKDNLYIEGMRDTKGRCFEFLTHLSGFDNHPMTNYHIVEFDPINGRDTSVNSEDDYLGVTYSVSYPASFVQIAQAERHRTLKYYMQFNPNCLDKEYFIPYIIRGTKYEEEWLRDLDSVSDLIPQATMIGIIETGHISDFILKCKERLCGRAQLEIMKQTEETSKRFVEKANSEEASKVFKSYVDSLVNDSGCLKTKCQLVGSCKEPCSWIKIKIRLQD